MPKKRTSEPKSAEAVTAPPKAFFKEPASSKARPQPSGKTVSYGEVLEELRGMGKGWDKETESLLGLPATLFRTSGDGARYYSKEESFAIGDVVLGLRYGELGTPRTSYGIAVYDTSGTTYLVLVDMRRRIIVRERLYCVHDEPPEKDWSAVKDAIRAAAALSAGDPAIIAVSDGTLRTLALK